METKDAYIIYHEDVEIIREMVSKQRGVLQIFQSTVNKSVLLRLYTNLF